MESKTTFNFFNLLLLLSFAGILVQSILLIIHYPTLPESIPTHFNFRGEPDNYGSKKFLLLIFGIGIAVAALILFIIAKAKSLPVNWPGKEINVDAIRSAGKRICIIVLFFMTIVWLEIIWSTIRVATGESSGLGPAFTIMFIVAGISIAFASIWMLYKSASVDNK